MSPQRGIVFTRGHLQLLWDAAGSGDGTRVPEPPQQLVQWMKHWMNHLMNYLPRLLYRRRGRLAMIRPLSLVAALQLWSLALLRVLRQPAQRPHRTLSCWRCCFRTLFLAPEDAEELAFYHEVHDLSLRHGLAMIPPLRLVAALQLWSLALLRVLRQPAQRPHRPLTFWRCCFRTLFFAATSCAWESPEDAEELAFYHEVDELRLRDGDRFARSRWRWLRPRRRHRCASGPGTGTVAELGQAAGAPRVPARLMVATLVVPAGATLVVPAKR